MATIFDLLAALNRGDLPPLPAPAPSMPLGVAAPPVGLMPPGPAPDMAPAAPLPALDMGMVNQFAGQAPTRPTLSDPSTLDKIAAVLGGIAGGPGYALALREQREAPLRRYEQELERFNQRRAGGLELATRKQEREQERAQRQAERNADREFEIWAQKAKITDETARQQARQAFDLQKLREQERAADERQAAQLQAAQEKERRTIETDLASKDAAPPSIAKEISEYRVGLRPELSAAAQKWQGARARKLLAQLERIGGGGSGSGPVMARLAGGQMVPLSVVKDGAVMLNGESIPVVEYVGGRIPARQGQPTPTDVKGVGPEGFPLALGTPGGPVVSETPKPKMSRGAAKAKLVKAGYSSAQADRELDALGIK